MVISDRALGWLGSAVAIMAMSRASAVDKVYASDVMRIKDLDVSGYPEDIQQACAALSERMSREDIDAVEATKIIELIVALYRDVCMAEGRADKLGFLKRSPNSPVEFP